MSQNVAFGGCNTHILAHQRRGCDVAQRTVHTSFGHQLECRTGHAGTGTIGFQAAFSAAAALPASGHDGCMAQFAGKTIAAVNHLAVDDDAAAHTGAQGYFNEILHPLGCAVSHLAQSGSVGVIGHHHRNAQRRLKEFGQRHTPLPGKVGRIEYFAGIEVGVGSADAHALNAGQAAHTVHQRQKLGHTVFHIELCRIVSGCRHGDSLHDTRFPVYDAEDGIRTAKVQTDYVGFIFHCFCKNTFSCTKICIFLWLCKDYRLIF